MSIKFIKNCLPLYQLFSTFLPLTHFSLYVWMSLPSPPQTHFQNCLSLIVKRKISKWENNSFLIYSSLLFTWGLIFMKLEQEENFVSIYIYIYIYIYVGYHLPFQHNELFHLPYMAVAETRQPESVYKSDQKSRSYC